MSSKNAILVTLLLLSSANDPQKAICGDLDRLQGDWTMVSGRVDGVESVIDAGHATACTVHANHVSFLHDGKVVEQVTIKLDPGKTPKAIDATLANKMVAPGIYRLDEGTFTLCYTRPDADRPADFNAKAGSGHKLSVWKRPTKATAKR